MAPRRLVVVGGVAAGMSAASRARRVDPDLEVVVFERTGYVSYGSCGLPYLLGGLVERPGDLVVYTPEFFREKRRIEVHVGHEVTGIDPERRVVTAREVSEAREVVVSYDVLILATGARAVRPRLPGMDRPGVFVLRVVEDGIALRGWVEGVRANARAAGGAPARAVVIGGGPLGLEAAENFRRLGLEVAVVEQMPQVLPGYHPRIAERVRAELERHRVRVYEAESVAAVEGDGPDGAVRAVVTDRRTLAADVVLAAAGVRPNVELARSAGVALGATGAVAVDDHLRTNVPGIFAAGDSAEAWHRLLGRPVWVPLGTTANKQGRVAGENAAGGDARFPGIVGTAALQVFGIEVGRTGLSVEQAREAGFDPVGVHVRHGSRAHYYPGGGPLDVWLVGDRPTGRLLGAEMVGPAGSVAKRVDVMAVALTAGLRVEEVEGLDLSYAPPLAPVWDPVLMAAREWRRAVKEEAST